MLLHYWPFRVYVVHLPMFLRVYYTLALEQSRECSNGSEIRLTDTGKIEDVRKYNKAHILCVISMVCIIFPPAPTRHPSLFNNARVVMHFISPGQFPVMSQMIVINSMCFILHAPGMKRPLKTRCRLLTPTSLICKYQLRKCLIPTCH